jgi:hypothetical protein
MKIETPLLKRLGPVPFWRGETRCLDVLEPMYRRAMERSRELCYNNAKNDDEKNRVGEQ